jgi:hypothetical protein
MSLSLAALLLMQVDLDPVLRFSAPARCELAPPFAALVESLAQIDPATFEARSPAAVAVPGYDRPIVPRFERTRVTDAASDVRNVTVDLATPGRWHGLRVLGLRRSFVEEGDSSSVEIRFAGRPERIRQVLNRLGFRVPAVGRGRVIDPEQELTAEIRVERIAGGAALVCAVG